MLLYEEVKKEEERGSCFLSFGNPEYFHSSDPSMNENENENEKQKEEEE